MTLAESNSFSIIFGTELVRTGQNYIVRSAIITYEIILTHERRKNNGRLENC